MLSRGFLPENMRSGMKLCGLNFIGTIALRSKLEIRVLENRSFQINEERVDKSLTIWR
jgi:hypothetical protein